MRSSEDTPRRRWVDYILLPVDNDLHKRRPYKRNVPLHPSPIVHIVRLLDVQYLRYRTFGGISSTSFRSIQTDTEAMEADTLPHSYIHLTPPYALIKREYTTL